MQSPYLQQCMYCGSILSLVQIIFPFVFGYGNVCNEFKTKENKI